MLDLVDQMQFLEKEELKDNAVVEINAALAGLSDDIKLQISRDLMLEQIYILVEKFPIATQKEMLAKMTHNYLNKWSNKK